MIIGHSRVARIASTAVRVTLACVILTLAGCVPGSAHTPLPSSTPSSTRTRPTPSPSPTPPPEPPAPPPPAPPPPAGSVYPWHTGIVSTTFWVGEIFDPDAPDGSQEISTYDSDWLASYGGCDGIAADGCATERRTAANGYFPSSMTPLQNPFYLDLPYDDINDDEGFAQRDSVIPWAAEYAAHRGDRSVSYLKNRWVELRRNGATCFGQVEDAGPGEYHDAAYVFGGDDARPVNQRYGGAGMDVSPALTGCLGFPEVNGIADGIQWRFVDERDVPPGPWRTLVTTSGVR